MAVAPMVELDVGNGGGDGKAGESGGGAGSEPSMAANRAKLPPGSMIMVLLSFEW
jgi:hypothetical protein